MHKPVLILGAGITGLALGYLLQQQGVDFIILEKDSRPGGHIRSFREGPYLMDAGPNSLQAQYPVVQQMIDELGLQAQQIFARPAASRRYIVRRGKLHPLPMRPKDLLVSRLLSFRAKMQLLREPFVKPAREQAAETLASFVRRRLGEEWLNYVVNPFIAGVFAGDPERLHAASAFPMLYRLEQEYGSLLKGMKQMAKSKQNANPARGQLFSFESGMQALPDALYARLHQQVLTEMPVSSIRCQAGSFEVICRQGADSQTFTSQVLVSTLPAYALAALADGDWAWIKPHLQAIVYPPVMVVFAAYPLHAIQRPLDGFGFLVPAKENLSFLGAIWNSAIFPGRAPADQAAFTLFAGGMRHPEIATTNQQEWATRMLKEFEKIMDIHQPPVFTRQWCWNEAIPQYDLSYPTHISAFQQLEQQFPGLYLAGNYRGGISVGNCLQTARQLAERIVGQIKG
ncbi:oxygen-dependent protoporphyrinogen oxidase [Thermoflavifilum aggregans]|uniref:Coproporphyrinogen III oxidase n=1 Tax=Thermoflavifilum aggregans TaxID=454188 RepID=A0A2M9CRI8_9BACT|nr:protoporphyrinogen oxidase [Thermoflavifilum aggregans]PJJ74556.1 oxygen-dependent protoporphyrinogen oxidase [Thermoflavifilum aggregans]